MWNLNPIGAMTEHYSHFRLEDLKPVVEIEEGLGI